MANNRGRKVKLNKKTETVLKKVNPVEQEVIGYVTPELTENLKLFVECITELEQEEIVPEHVSEELEAIEDVKEEISFEKISKVVHGEIDDINPTFGNAPIEIKIEDEKPQRTMDSLTKAEYRYFQRTGTMPK